MDGVRSGQRDEILVVRVVRGAVAGVLAGLLFVGVTMWFASETGGKSEMPLRMMSTIVKGDGAMEAGTSSVGLGWVVHLVLSAAFGIGFALVVPMLRTNGTVALVGTMYGAALYVVNFVILAPIAFPTFEMTNQPFELLAHIVFGTLLSFAFFSTGARRQEPRCAMDRPARETVGA